MGWRRQGTALRVIFSMLEIGLSDRESSFWRYTSLLLALTGLSACSVNPKPSTTEIDVSPPEVRVIPENCDPIDDPDSPGPISVNCLNPDGSFSVRELP